MVTQWTVLGNLKQISSLDEEETAALPLCLTCLEDIRARLKAGADTNDPCIERAAAGLAFYKLMLKRITEDGTVTSFKAGDMSVTQKPAELLRLAATVRDEAIAGAAPLLKDEDFLFMKVGIV